MINKISKFAPVCVLMIGLVNVAFAHGYIEQPGSRNYYCGAITKPDQAVYNPSQAAYQQCKEVFILPDGGMNQDGYNYMSIVTHTTGRQGVGVSSGAGSNGKPVPNETKLPANVCSFDSEGFSPKTVDNPLGRGPTIWDKPIDWPTSPMTAGTHTFIWNIAAGPHFDDTEEFVFWITKPDYKFQVGKALTWNDLETAPFCNLKFDYAKYKANHGAYPNITMRELEQKFDLKCNVPARSGRHVIYAEWGRNPSTYERFHSCMDVVFNAGGESAIPVVSANIALSPNTDKVTGENTILLIGTGSKGESLTYQWSVDSVEQSSYTLTNATHATATLHLLNPNAENSVEITLTVRGKSGSHSDAVKTIMHYPSVAASWKDLGQLTRTEQTLKAGYVVWVRAVSNTGQDIYFPSKGLVITENTAAASAWPYALATEINKQESELTVGVLSNDVVTPVHNATGNRIYAKNNSTIEAAYLKIMDVVVVESQTESTTAKPESATESPVTGGGTVPPPNPSTHDKTIGGDAASEDTNTIAATAPAASSGGGCSAITNGNDYSLILLLIGSTLYAYRRRQKSKANKNQID